jgi:hypothetical protein
MVAVISLICSLSALLYQVSVTGAITSKFTLPSAGISLIARFQSNAGILS